ncbi:hypothetical protein HZA96_04520 [Candidatus Woesearchaeota archaeon]|nr:hypothetical protein [Candidatus Woesearchaeota archaeon]
MTDHQEEKSEQKSNFITKVKHIYETKYKLLFGIVLFILFLSFVQIGYQYATTGEFLHKGVSIKGGLTVTILTEKGLDYNYVTTQLYQNFGKEIQVKILSIDELQNSLVIEADITDTAEIESFISHIEKITGLKKDKFTIEVTGPSLGDSFFHDTVIALLIAFLAMGIVVFLYFRVPIPSLAVMLSALSDIVITLAIVNLMGIKISASGIVAFLLVIGFSVDTDILLTIKVLKRKEGSVMDRIYNAIKIGTLMTFCSIAAVSIGLLLSKSEVISQIMLILLIGLIVDLFTTWIQNVAILRLYLERKEKHESKN